MGLDAYHHTLVTALFLDRGGVPHDYAPYAPLASFTYHFGFHAFAAALGWLAPGALPVERLMPLAGQLATALPVLTLALFGCARARQPLRRAGRGRAGRRRRHLSRVLCQLEPLHAGPGPGPAAGRLGRRSSTRSTPIIAWHAGRAPLRAIRTGAWRTWLGPAALAAVSVAGLFLTHYRIAALFASYAGAVPAAPCGRAPPAGGRARGPPGGRCCGEPGCG